MAKAPSKSSKSKMSNIMGILSGKFDFKKDKETPSETAAYGSPELISQADRTKILSGAARVIDDTRRIAPTAGSLMGLVQASMTKVTNDRLENRKILTLMPEVDKAARLMVASIFSPNDLSRQNISVTFDDTTLNESTQKRLNDAAATFFQKKMNLKTSAPSWVYQYGYETGAAIFAIIPLQSFNKIQESSYVGTESFVRDVVEPLCHESLFGFGDTEAFLSDFKKDVVGLESFGRELIIDSAPDEKKTGIKNEASLLSKAFIEKCIGHEALSLTDNPSVLQAGHLSREKRKQRTAKTLKQRYKAPMAEPIVSVSADRDVDKRGGVTGNPIMMRLPPESVTVIHTPGDPSDHQGYLVLLDFTGNPINAVTQQENSATLNTNNNQTNVFTQIYNAYGINNGNQTNGNQETMERIYTEIVSKHIHQRLGKAGYGQVEMGNLDSIFRCMFGRFLQQKQTRILFLPKDLVSYMTFEMDQNGYGISRLDRVKFNLSMKMAVQVSRVLAAIKAAMDRRKIEIRFDDNFMEQPESIFQDLIREYTNKNTLSFSIDPNVIQNQIASKSMSIKGTGIPGMENFDVTNEPDSRSTTMDFDPNVLEYMDKQILNGLRVPASTMNSLNEDEYARSVTTTNLFFAMDVSIDQDITVKNISDLLRKYARFSEEFQEEIYKILPTLRPGKKNKGNSSTDESSSTDDDDEALPENYDLDKLIDAMSISLPAPNVAPSKAQFEALEAMTNAVKNMVDALIPDDMVGKDDTLRPVIALIRARTTSSNIRDYLAGSGMTGFKVPDTNFTDQIQDIGQFDDAIRNIAALLGDKAKLGAPPEDVAPPIPGYQ